MAKWLDHTLVYLLFGILNALVNSLTIIKCSVRKAESLKRVKSAILCVFAVN